MSRLKLGRRCCRCFSIPRTNVLADVATKQVMADVFAKLLGNRATQFNVEVSDTAAAIEEIGSHDSLCWTGVDAFRAGAAAVRCRIVRVEFEICHDTAEKDPGTDLVIDDTGVLPE